MRDLNLMLKMQLLFAGGTFLTNQTEVRRLTNEVRKFRAAERKTEDKKDKVYEVQNKKLTGTAETELFIKPAGTCQKTV